MQRQLGGCVEYVCVAMAMEQLQDRHKLSDEMELGGVHCLVTVIFHSCEGNYICSQCALLGWQLNSEQLAWATPVCVRVVCMCVGGGGSNACSAVTF